LHIVVHSLLADEFRKHIEEIAGTAGSAGRDAFGFLLCANENVMPERFHRYAPVKKS
jgi:hypothetical protein